MLPAFIQVTNTPAVGICTMQHSLAQSAARHAALLSNNSHGRTTAARSWPLDQYVTRDTATPNNTPATFARVPATALARPFDHKQAGGVPRWRPPGPQRLPPGTSLHSSRHLGICYMSHARWPHGPLDPYNTTLHTIQKPLNEYIYINFVFVRGFMLRQGLWPLGRGARGRYGLVTV